MHTVRMTASGQVAIPRELRERLGLKPGDELEFAPGPGRTLLLRARNRRAGLLADLPVVGVSREEMCVLLTGSMPGTARAKPAQ